MYTFVCVTQRSLFTASPRNFELAFKMFDINGDGTLDFDEFVQVLFQRLLFFRLPHKDDSS